MTLEGEQILVETLNRLLLQNVVDAIPSVQQPHLHLGLLLSLWLWALWDPMVCSRSSGVINFLHCWNNLYVGVEQMEKLTLFNLLLLLFDLIGHDGQLGLELGRRGVSAGKVVERLPGTPKGADETLLQV